jgi:DNA-directed RNA polymerase alpha subunit
VFSGILSLQILKPAIQYVGVGMSTLQQTPIEKFKLPEKLIRILHRNDIDTFGELQEVANQGNLLCLRRVGKKFAAELIQLVAQPDRYLAADQNDVNDGENTHPTQNRSELLIQLERVSVEKLELRPKVIHALTRAGIFTIGDLLLIQPSQRSQIYRIGPKANRDIQIALDKALNSPEKYIE